MTTAVATQGEAARVVLASEIRDDESGFDFLGAPWVYVRSGAQIDTQRRLVSQDEVGYQGSLGAAMVTRPFAAALASGVTVEFTNPLPCKRYAGVKGLNDCVDEALVLIWVPVVLTVTGNGTYEYDLSPLPFLIHDWQFQGVYDTFFLNTPATAILSPWDVRMVTDGVTRTLVTETLYSTSDTFYLHCIVRAQTIVYDGSSWSYTGSPGLANDTYQAAAPEGWVKAFGMVKALQQVEKMVRADRRIADKEQTFRLVDIQARRLQWARTAAAIKMNLFPKPLARRQEGMVYADVGPIWV